MQVSVQFHEPFVSSVQVILCHDTIETSQWWRASEGGIQADIVNIIGAALALWRRPHLSILRLEDNGELMVLVDFLIITYIYSTLIIIYSRASFQAQFCNLYMHSNALYAGLIYIYIYISRDVRDEYIEFHTGAPTFNFLS